MEEVNNIHEEMGNFTKDQETIFIYLSIYLFF